MTMHDVLDVETVVRPAARSPEAAIKYLEASGALGAR
jgi:hypothetical protein